MIKNYFSIIIILLCTTTSFAQKLKLKKLYADKNKSDITLALQTHKINIPFAVLETDDIEINEIHEKPTISKKVNAGIYIINPSIINSFCKKPDFLDMPDLIKLAIKNK